MQIMHSILFQWKTNKYIDSVKSNDIDIDLFKLDIICDICYILTFFCLLFPAFVLFVCRAVGHKEYGSEVSW